MARPSKLVKKDKTLTSTETKVYNLLIEGWSNQEIGGSLGLAEATVKTHVTALFVKLGFATRTKLIAGHYKSKLLGHY